MCETIEDALEYFYNNAGSFYVMLSLLLILYGIFIQVWLIVCLSIASFVCAIINFIRKDRVIKKRDDISKKLDVYTLEQKKELIERELPSIPLETRRK